ncbi:MAG: hypothetical protein LBH05_04590 [Deferribacteraceae bacterium]|nr:hypothetical protein [Deferribacteraceae bacterium]
MSRFGMSMESSENIGDDLNRLVLKDNTHNTGYIAIAKRKDVKNPDFWGNLIDNQLKNALQESAYKGEALPAALIVPSDEADAVIAQSAERGIKPSVYQLFDGYVVIGYNRKDSQKLIKNTDNTPQTENSQSENTEREPAPAESEQTETAPKTPDVQNISKGPSKLAGISPKKLAAAALLGVTVASIPFAINKLQDDHNVAEKTAEPPAVKEILTNVNEGNAGLPDIQAALASNAPLPDYYLEKLISDGYLRDVAQNPNISGDLLSRFASDNDPLARAAAARNKTLPEEVLRRLASDKSPEVRAAVASNPNLPIDILNKLSLDCDAQICSAILENPNLTPRLLDRLEPSIAHATCANKEKIYAGPCVSRAALAYNAANPDPCIRRGIAKNPRTDKDTLNALRNDTDRTARDMALANPSIDKKELMDIFPVSWGGNGNDEEKSSPEKVKDIQAALKNSSTPESILRGALTYDPEKFGEAAAHSPALSGRNAAVLYDYSVPRGGMNGFFEGVYALPYDKTLLGLMKDRDEPGKISKDKALSALRAQVNKLFADNLYNPITAAQVQRLSGGGQSGSGSDGEKKADKNGYNRINMRETGDGGAFFENEPILSLNDKEFDRFGEFFEGEELPLSDKGRALLEIADSIIDDVMEELAPVMERAAAGKGADLLPAKSGVKSVTPDGDQTGEYSQTRSNDSAGKTFSGAVPVQKRDRGAAPPILSDGLYEKSCRQIDSMLSLF